MKPFSDIEAKLFGDLTLDELELRLRPGRPKGGVEAWSDYSVEGFLTREENLRDVVKTDYDLLLELGVEYQEMARYASEVLQQGSPTFNDGFFAKFGKSSDVSLDRDRFSFMSIPSMGFQTCPWGCTGKDDFGYSTFGGGQIYIQDNTRSKEENLGFMDEMIDKGRSVREAMTEISYTVVTDLTPHLIATHHFFEGNVAYRTDPRKLLEVVGKR